MSQQNDNEQPAGAESAGNDEAPKKIVVKVPKGTLPVRGVRVPRMNRKDEVLKAHRRYERLKKNTWFTNALMVVGFAACIALIADLYRFAKGASDKTQTPKALLDNVTGCKFRYTDPAGRFSILKPEGWIVMQGDEADPYAIRLIGPSGMEVDLLLMDKPEVTYIELKAIVAGAEHENGINTHIAEDTLKGHQVLRRRCVLNVNGFCMLDFLDRGRAFQMTGIAPAESFEALLPVLRGIMDSIEPLGK